MGICNRYIVCVLFGLRNEKGENMGCSYKYVSAGVGVLVVSVRSRKIEGENRVDGDDFVWVFVRVKQEEP